MTTALALKLNTHLDPSLLAEPAPKYLYQPYPHLAGLHQEDPSSMLVGLHFCRTRGRDQESQVATLPEGWARNPMIWTLGESFLRAEYLDRDCYAVECVANLEYRV
jgi:hypothetical protein